MYLSITYKNTQNGTNIMNIIRVPTYLTTLEESIIVVLFKLIAPDTLVDARSVSLILIY